jgi:hypothetical protein
MRQYRCAAFKSGSKRSLCGRQQQLPEGGALAGNRQPVSVRYLRSGKCTNRAVTHLWPLIAAQARQSTEDG